MNDAETTRIYAEKAKIYDVLKEIVTTYESNVNDEDGDKYLSDPNLAMEIIGDILLDAEAHGLHRAKREGWIA